MITAIISSEGFRRWRQSARPRPYGADGPGAAGGARPGGCGAGRRDRQPGARPALRRHPRPVAPGPGRHRAPSSSTPVAFPGCSGSPRPRTSVRRGTPVIAAALRGRAGHQARSARRGPVQPQVATPVGGPPPYAEEQPDRCREARRRPVTAMARAAGTSHGCRAARIPLSCINFWCTVHRRGRRRWPARRGCDGGSGYRDG